MSAESRKALASLNEPNVYSAPRGSRLQEGPASIVAQGCMQFNRERLHSPHVTPPPPTVDTVESEKCTPHVTLAPPHLTGLTDTLVHSAHCIFSYCIHK
jgi:hypothetical protein